MQFLSYAQCAEWCSQRGFPTRQMEGYIVGPDPDLQPPEFHFAEFTPPVDSGRKVWLARFLYPLLQPQGELLIWLGDWAVWPSSQHMPLFTRFREAFGEKRRLIEAPGHLLTLEEADDAISIISVSLLFMWNCHVLSDSGRDAVFISHDEFGWFATRDPAVAATTREKISEALSRR
jgi:hypothetical protein